MADRKEKKKFFLRSFITFSLVFSTIIMSWSGFILYVAPPGRIANWGTWKLMLFTKAEWQALHTIFSYLFFILFIIHLFFVNWKAFLSYIKTKIKSGLNRKWELLSATALSAVIFIGTLRSWTPFGPVMSFGEKVKEGWGNKFETPPVIHMENYTLKQLSPDFDSAAPADLAKALTNNKISIRSSDSTLKQIGEENNMTPAEIYRILATKYNKPAVPTGEHGGGSAQGFGRYTLIMAAENSGKELSELIEILKERGIDVKGETTLRAIADQLGMVPRDVYNMLTGK